MLAIPNFFFRSTLDRLIDLYSVSFTNDPIIYHVNTVINNTFQRQVINHYQMKNKTLAK